mgnify:FL=1
MKKIYYFFFLILLGGTVQAQEKGYKLWTDGKLTIEDFQPRNVQSVGFTLDPIETSFLDAEIDFKMEKKRDGNLRFVYPVSCTKADLLNSWYAPDYYTSWTIRYNQVIFDIVEATRREMQNELNTNGIDSYDGDYQSRLLKSRIDSFKGESAYGRDTSVIKNYELQYTEMLDTLFEKELVGFPGKIRKGWGVGLYFGYSPEVYFGKINDWVSMAHRVTAGMDVYYKKFVFEISYSEGSSGILKKGDIYTDTKKGYIWNAGEKVSAHDFLFKMGYTVFDGSVFSVIPAFGVGVGGFGQDTGYYDKDDNAITSNMDGLKLTAGTDIWVKLYREYDYFDMIGEIPIRFSVYGAWTRLHPCDVFSINAGIKVSIDSWMNKN